MRTQETKDNFRRELSDIKGSPETTLIALAIIELCRTVDEAVEKLVKAGITVTVAEI